LRWFWWAWNLRNGRKAQEGHRDGDGDLPLHDQWDCTVHHKGDRSVNQHRAVNRDQPFLKNHCWLLLSAPSKFRELVDALLDAEERSHVPWDLVNVIGDIALYDYAHACRVVGPLGRWRCLFQPPGAVFVVHVRGLTALALLGSSVCTCGVDSMVDVPRGSLGTLCLQGLLVLHDDIFCFIRTGGLGLGVH
jgi:hypothetical protein